MDPALENQGQVLLPGQHGRINSLQSMLADGQRLGERQGSPIRRDQSHIIRYKRGVIRKITLVTKDFQESRGLTGVSTSGDHIGLLTKSDGSPMYQGIAAFHKSPTQHRFDYVCVEHVR